MEIVEQKKEGLLILRKLSILLIFMLILVSACSSGEQEGKQDEINSDLTPVYDGMGDIHEETSSKETLPQFLDNHAEEMQIIYRAVAEHQELLEHIPCYCGCGESVNHSHNYHCFIYENKNDGSVVWDDHATRCQICLDIAAESIIEYNDGKTIDEVRMFIEEKYEGQGFPEPTDTPNIIS